MHRPLIVSVQKQLRSFAASCWYFMRQNPLFIGSLVLFIIAGLLVGIARYRTYIDGFDYSVFTQTLWHYSNFELPRSSIRDVNLILGDHFHPLLIILTPLFWIWNNPLVLVIVQPVLFALSAVPLYLLGRKHFGKTLALTISSAYLLSHGLQFALYFDFHEIALAVPLVSVLIYCIDTQRYRGVIVSAILLCLVKEEMILLVSAAGLVLILKKRKYKLGGFLIVGSLLFFVTLTKFLMPLLAGKQRFHEYWTYDSYGSSVGDILKNIATKPVDFIRHIWRGVFENQTKTDTLWITIVTGGFSILLSWYALLAVPDLLIRMLSDQGTFYWSYWFHYGAILMPIVFFCFIDVLRKLQKRLPSSFLAVICIALLAFNIGMMFNKNFPFAQLANSEFYNTNHQVRSGEDAVKQIVRSGSITAPVTITPHFANRDTIRILTDKGRWYTDEEIVLTGKPTTDYVILNERLPITDVDPYSSYANLRKDVEEIGYQLRYQNTDSGWIVYQKPR